MSAAPNAAPFADAPAPVPATEAEAIATLRMIAAMHGGMVVRVYGGGRSPPMRLRELRGLAVMIPSLTIAWDDRPTWVFSAAQGILVWGAPNVLKGNASYVTWRGIDETNPP